MAISDEILLEKLENIKKINKKAIEKGRQFDNMSWVQFLQTDEGMPQLRRLEKEQKATFEKILKKRHPSLLKDKGDLFAEYFMNFLAEKVKSINDFLYIDRLAPVGKRQLKKEFEQ